MDTKESTLEEKCENLMSIVVESRKILGKMCINYEEKTSVIKGKMLNLQLKRISDHHFKPKYSVPHIDLENINKDIDDFKYELEEKKTRMENLKKKLKNTESIVLQLEKDNIGRKLREPLTVEAMLKQAKEKNIE